MQYHPTAIILALANSCAWYVDFSKTCNFFCFCYSQIRLCLILNCFHRMAKLTFNSYSSNLTYIFLLSSDRMIQVQSIWKIVRSVWRRNPFVVWWKSWGWKSYWLLIFLSVPYVFLRYVKRSWRKKLQLVRWFSSSSILCILISFWDLYFIKKKEQIKLEILFNKCCSHPRWNFES